MFAVGQRVVHNYKQGHGPGVVAEVRPFCPGKHDPKYGGPAYCSCKYPYVVQFDSGFKEVYSERDLRKE